MPFVRVNHFYKSASPGQTIEVSQEEADLIISRGGGVLLPDPAPAPDAPPAPAAPVVSETAADLSVGENDSHVNDCTLVETIEIAVAPVAEADDDSDPIDVLAGHGLSDKVLAALSEADIRTLAELRQIEDLTDVTGIGKVTAAKIAEALARHEQR